MAATHISHEQSAVVNDGDANRKVIDIKSKPGNPRMKP